VRLLPHELSYLYQEREPASSSKAWVFKGFLQVKLESLRDSYKKFQEFFKGSIALTKTVEDRYSWSYPTYISSTSSKGCKWILMQPSI
jgi:hypothetical protein